MQRLLMFLCGIVLAAFANAQPDNRAGSAPPTYRVVNLGSGEFSLGAVMNARGQAAFSIVDGSAIRGYVYDGRTTRALPGLGGSFNVVAAINEAGQVAGYASLAGDAVNHAYLWSARAGLADLGTPTGAGSSTARALNNRSQVVGGWFSDPIGAVFRWGPRRGNEDLGRGPYFTASATLLNDAGLMAGEGFPDASSVRGFVWSARSGLVDIGTLGGPSTRLRGIAADGTLGGSAETPTGASHAVVWDSRHGMRDLGTDGGTASYGVAMSASGQLVGFLMAPDGDTFARKGFSWTRASGIVRIGTLAGANSTALAVNNRGQVVGWSDSTHGQTPVAWTARGGLVDLNASLRHAPPGLVLDAPLAISDSGAIVASSNAGLVLLDPARGGGGHVAAGPIALPYVAAAGTPVDASVAFAGEALAPLPWSGWNWGDGSARTARRIASANGVARASATHTYAAPGTYTVTAQLTDDAGHGVTVARDIVVYAPARAFIGGQGAIMLAPGTGQAARGQPARASFSFAATPAGAGAAANATGRLRFHAGAQVFLSNDLAPAGTSRQPARLTGTGTMNGVAGYRVAVVAQANGVAPAGAAAKIGLRIWHADPATAADMIDFDNLGAEGAGANLVQGLVMMAQ